MIFGFMSMMTTYEQRKIERYNSKDFFVSTAMVTDSTQPYETAVCHKKYNNNKVIIVQMYNTKKVARLGHKKWVKKMSAKKLPSTLKDVSTATIIKLAKVFDVDLNNTYKIKKTRKNA